MNKKKYTKNMYSIFKFEWRITGYTLVDRERIERERDHLCMVLSHWNCPSPSHVLSTHFFSSFLFIYKFNISFFTQQNFGMFVESLNEDETIGRA